MSKYSNYKKKELQEELDSRNIEYASSQTNEELVELLEEDDFNNNTTMIRYIGRAQRATRRGEVTNTFYTFEKTNNVPEATAVYNDDINFLLAEKGESCCNRAPYTLFILDEEYEEIDCNSTKE